jgi:hypothetical protein
MARGLTVVTFSLFIIEALRNRPKLPCHEHWLVF